MGKAALWITFPAMLAGLPGGALLQGCGSSASPATNPEAQSSVDIAEAVVPHEATSQTSPARWVLMPDRATSSNQRSSSTAAERIVDGVRVRYEPSRAPIGSADFIPGSNIESLTLPTALGGGFVFHSDVDAETAFWRAEDWTAPASPLTRLPERADQIEVGFGRIYARLADSAETVAFDPKTGQSVTLKPLPASPSYFDFQFWDDWFAVVHTDARGVLATFDGGMTWHPTGITAEDASLGVEPGGIVIATSERRDLLAPDGTWTPEYESPVGDATNVDPMPKSSLARDPLELAVLHGAPLGKGRALVANWGHVGVVDTNTGEVVALQLDRYAGSLPCQGVALGKPKQLGPSQLGVGFVCLLTSGETVIYSVSTDLSLEPIATWQARVEVWSSHNGVLVANSCPSTALAGRGSYCVFGNGRAQQHLTVTGATDSDRVVALRDGRVAALTPPRAGKAGALRLAHASEGDLVTTQAVALRFEKDTPDKLRSIAESGLWLRDAGETKDGKLGFWVASANRLVGVTVNLDGTISLSQRTEADLRRTHLSGPRAFELSAGETAWQSLDFGRSWQEVTVPRGLTSASTRETHDIVGCSAVGCSFGNWLRVGYDPANSTIPAEASQPPALPFRASAYSQWGLSCYPTGINEAAPRGSAASTSSTGQGRARYGTSSGFSNATLGSTAADVANSANRPFLGVARPVAPPGSFAFDMGADGTHQFRAYAWGQDGEAWRNSSAWLTRVADRFSVAGLWSTAPTRGPWPNLLSAAQLFGADRANRYSSSWQLSLDPSERAGVLRITTTGTTELHFIEEGAATTSVGNTAFGPISGVVKVQKTWYFGTQEGNRFHVYRVRNGSVEDFADFPIGDPVAPMLSRNTRATALALVLRAPAGTWHIYPLSEHGEAGEPIVLTREMLNTEWPRCDDDALGYYVLGSLPLSRFTPNDGAEVLSFEAVPSEWKAEAVTARTIVSSTSQCVEALAARLASNQEAIAPQSSPPPKSGSIPLTLTDRLSDVRYGFQCLR
jgi:hypothetical protein